MRNVLLVEYEYTRSYPPFVLASWGLMYLGIYVNSLALQAVVDRWTTMSNEAAQAGKPGSAASGGGWFQVLMELYRVNEPYIQQVVDASRKILQIVLDRLVPAGHLKHAPVRTCFRILSGMIFILKVFPLLVTLRDGTDPTDLHAGREGRRCPCIAGSSGPDH